jgi:hypothetical protein
MERVPEKVGKKIGEEQKRIKRLKEYAIKELVMYNTNNITTK